MKDIRIRNTPEFEENIRVIKEYYDIKTTSKVIRQAVRDTAMVAKYKEMTASEAIFGFAGWLTSREEQTVMSSKDDAGCIADLVQEFIYTNKLNNPIDNWEKSLIHPKK